jgi:D-arabinose 1-dehydrogenase-like Zn-dependent alcohol dehydrogenase
VERELSRLQGKWGFHKWKELKLKLLYFSVLGHEACVEIIEHKRTNFNLKTGDRATFCIADNCGQCEFCLGGLSQKCKSLFKVSRFWSVLFILKNKF